MSIKGEVGGAHITAADILPMTAYVSLKFPPPSCILNLSAISTPAFNDYLTMTSSHDSTYINGTGPAGPTSYIQLRSMVACYLSSCPNVPS